MLADFLGAESAAAGLAELFLPEVVLEALLDFLAFAVSAAVGLVADLFADLAGLAS